jgi:hypothetical protein
MLSVLTTMSASKRELADNASHWLKEAKRNHLGGIGVGAIFIFFNSQEVGTAVCTATVNRKLLKAHLKTILEKLDRDDHRVIIDPWENN